MKNGVLLTGGLGTRLRPLSNVISKHLISVGNKFVIDYPVETLKNLGCKDVVVVLGGKHFSQIVDYLQDGSRYGLNFNYLFQTEPAGISQAINLCKRFVYDDSDFSVVLGDNYFEKPIHWNNPNWKTHPKAQIVLSDHHKLNSFGVASIKDNQIIKIEEKPQVLDGTLENKAITGCYCFTPQYFEYFEQTKKSSRGEFEIVDIINKYKEDNNLLFTKSSGLWSDMGSHESIAYVNNYIYNKHKI